LGNHCRTGVLTGCIDLANIARSIAQSPDPTGKLVQTHRIVNSGIINNGFAINSTNNQLLRTGLWKPGHNDTNLNESLGISLNTYWNLATIYRQIGKNTGCYLPGIFA
jgi:hypothetical protein